MGLESESRALGLRGLGLMGTLRNSKISTSVGPARSSSACPVTRIRTILPSPT